MKNFVACGFLRKFALAKQAIDMNNQHSPKRRSRFIVISLNLLAMVAIFCGLVWLAMVWLDVWTGHGEEEIVPDVKGVQFDVAVERLNDAGLKVELSDSVYVNDVAPGTVVEQNPKVNAKVKPGRVVYLTINAFSPKMVTVPRLTDISVRQARSILEGLGIKKVNEVKIISDYENLVLGVKYNGVRLAPGARVPVTATITLEVGEGLPDEVMEDDTVASSQLPAIEHLDLN